MPNQPWTQGIILVSINSRKMDDKNQFGCLDLPCQGHSTWIQAYTGNQQRCLPKQKGK